MKKLLLYTVLFFAANLAVAQSIPHPHGKLKFNPESPFTYGAYLQALKDWEAAARPETTGMVVDLYKTDSLFPHFWNQDEMAWIQASKTSYSYDCNLGKKTMQLFQNSAPLVNSEKTDYTYYSNGNPLEEFGYTWYVEGNEWLPSDYSKYSMQGSLVETWQLWYFGSNLPAGGYRLLYGYTANNDVQSAEFYVVDLNTNSWMLFSSIVNTFDAQNKQVLSVRSELVSNNLTPIEQWLYTYDAAGNLVTSLKQVMEASQWVNAERYTNTFDANNLVTSALTESFVNMQWQPTKQIEHTYDVDGNRLTWLEKQYLAGAWQNVSLQTVQYYPSPFPKKTDTYELWAEPISSWYLVGYDSLDIDGNNWIKIDKRDFDPLTGVYEEGERTFSTWEDGLNVTWVNDKLVPFTADEWQQWYKSTCTVDDGNLFLECILQQYDSMAAEYVNSIKNVYHNSDCTVLGTAAPISTPMLGCLLANPYAIGQAIDCPGIEAGASVDVYNTAGMLASTQRTVGSSFSIEKDLSPGMYYLVVRLGGQVLYRTKLAVQ